MKPIIFLSLILVVLFKFAPSTNDHLLVTSSAWTKADSKAYARDKLQEWQNKEWVCLSNLWGKESSWNAHAYNSVVVMGKHAGGIPQLLGLDPNLPATLQRDRGLSYIYYRYGTPCRAWSFFKHNNWH